MYCTLDDLKGQINETTIANLTDDEGTGQIDLNKVNQAIGDAETEINAYTSKRYPTPFNPVPGIVKKLAVDMAIYNLFSRKGFPNEGDKVIQDRYNSAVRMLKDIANGTIQLGGTGETPAPPPPGGPEIKVSPRIFSRSSLRGM
jgi:phage gp36-like protein